MHLKLVPGVQKALADAQARVEALSGDLQTAMDAHKKLQAGLSYDLCWMHPFSLQPPGRLPLSWTPVSCTASAFTGGSDSHVSYIMTSALG